VPAGEHRYFARTTRGLELIAATEARIRLGASIEETSHRLIRFSLPREDAPIMALSTADDVFEEFASATGIGTTAKSLEQIAAVAKLVPQNDRTRMAGNFEVVASFIGARRYNRYDVEDGLGLALSKMLGGRYVSRRNGDPGAISQSWRTHLWDDRMVLGSRVSDRPMHRRPYRKETVPGALHPPVASAIALLAGVAPRDRVLDPFCGSGTLLIEAGRNSQVGGLVGFDINPHHVDIALRNAWAAELPVMGLNGDAADLPIADGSVDVVLANPPWGAQISAGGRFATNPLDFWCEIRRLLSPRGHAAILLDSGLQPPNWQVLDLHLHHKLTFAIAGRWATLYLLERAGRHHRMAPNPYLGAVARAASLQDEAPPSWRSKRRSG
jgi:23S rRNA G2445 N2-methylase RlmL